MGKVVCTPYPKKRPMDRQPRSHTNISEEEETALAGTMPLKSAVGLILACYYLMCLVVMHNLVSKRNPSIYECIVSTIAFLTVLLAFSGLYRSRPRRFLPLIALQLFVLVALMGTWVMYLMDHGYDRQYITPSNLANWTVRYLFSMSLAMLHYSCFITVYRYVKIIRANQSYENQLENSISSVVRETNDLILFGKNESCREATEDCGSNKKSVMFTV